MSSCYDVMDIVMLCNLASKYDKFNGSRGVVLDTKEEYRERGMVTVLALPEGGEKAVRMTVKTKYLTSPTSAACHAKPPSVIFETRYTRYGCSAENTLSHYADLDNWGTTSLQDKYTWCLAWYNAGWSQDLADALVDAKQEMSDAATATEAAYNTWQRYLDRNRPVWRNVKGSTSFIAQMNIFSEAQSALEQDYHSEQRRHSSAEALVAKIQKIQKTGAL